MEKGWAILFGVVLFACLLLFIVAPFIDGWWLPELANEGSYGSGVDVLFYVILYLTGFFFVLTEALLVYFMWKYRYDPKRRPVYTHGNHKLEMWWTVVPGIILLVIAFAQVSVWAEIKYTSQRPDPDHVIVVSARQFVWEMRYPDKQLRETMLKTYKPGLNNDDADTWGNQDLPNVDDLHTVNVVHTWKDANTQIYLKSGDVLHSFFLPNLRLKQDAVPGKVIPIWFKATKSNTEFVEIERAGTEDFDKIIETKEHGDNRLFLLDRVKDTTGTTTKIIALAVDKNRQWPLACAELCGWGHYKMRGRLFVHKNKQSYDKWLAFAWKKHHARAREN